MDIKKLPILSIVPVGTPEFQRYTINDEKNRRWNGERFVSTGEGVRYADYSDAAMDLQMILKKYFEGQTPTRYVVPVFIEVYGDVPVALVAQHLSKTASLFLDTPKQGYGPDGSLILPVIHWGQIEEYNGEGDND